MVSSSQPNVLFVDDDSEAVLALMRTLKSSPLSNAALHAASNPERALALVKELTPHVIVLDLSLNSLDGVESGYGVLREALKLSPTTRIIVLTGHSDTLYGIRALNEGAANFIAKPADVMHLRALILDGISQCSLRRERDELQSETKINDGSSLIGDSPAMNKVRESIRYAGRNPIPVLILGETGVGKGVCAATIHRLSSRANNHFVRYQPSLSGGDLTGSDLFGHVKGAFTGADYDRKGLIAEANSGTLFLDEIDSLSPQTQVALLGVLQDKIVRPLGANKGVESDFRLISATNADIEAAITNGSLRRDLYHRIAHLVIAIPPLRARKGDIKPLVTSFISKFQTRNQANIFNISNEALLRLTAYDWPGNIRELESQIDAAAYRAIDSGRSTIEVSDIELSSMNRSATENGNETFSEKVERFKLSIIQEALDKNGGNQLQAALALKMERSTLRRLISRLSR